LALITRDLAETRQTTGYFTFSPGDNALSQLMNGYLTPLSAWMYPKYYLNAPCKAAST